MIIYCTYIQGESEVDIKKLSFFLNKIPYCYVSLQKYRVLKCSERNRLFLTFQKSGKFWFEIGVVIVTVTQCITSKKPAVNKLVCQTKFFLNVYTQLCFISAYICIVKSCFTRNRSNLPKLCKEYFFVLK